MSVIYIVLPIALLLAVLGLGAFIWAVRKGQYDDLDTPAVRMLFDDEEGDSGTEKARTQKDRATETQRSQRIET